MTCIERGNSISLCGFVAFGRMFERSDFQYGKQHGDVVCPKCLVILNREANAPKCSDCKDSGFKPTSAKLKGMKAGEIPTLEFTFKLCEKGCPENADQLLEYFA